MAKRFLSLIAAAVLVPWSVNAQTPPAVLDGEALASALPPPSAVAAALDLHPSVVAAGARVDAARAEAGALASGSQEFTVNVAFVRRSVDREGRYDEYDATVMRPLRLPGKAALDRAAGGFGIAAARNRAEDARHQAALLLADSWWDWLAAAAELRIDQQAERNYAATLAAVRRRVELRDAAQLEADQAEAAMGAARLVTEQARGREAVTRVRLSARFPSLTLPAEPPEPPAPALPSDGLSRFGELIVARSHEIAAADAEAARSDVMARRVRQDRIADPSVGLRLFSERGGAERGAGVVMSLPLGGSHRRALATRASMRHR